MVDLLGQHSIEIRNQDGLCLSVAVLNEQQAQLVLASHVIAALGNSGSAIPSYSPSLHWGIGTKLDDPERIADGYAKADREFVSPWRRRQNCTLREGDGRSTHDGTA